MQNNDYFSDDETVLSEQEQDNQEELLEEAIQRELYQSIQNKTSKLDLDSLMVKPKVNHKPETKERRHKPSSVMSLADFNKEVIDKATDKPKKFVSKRAEEKRKAVGMEEKVEYRKFNPRKPPYNFVHKNKTVESVNINNNTEFPTLK